MTAVPMIDVTKEVLERHRTPLEPLRPISAVFDPNNEVIYRREVMYVVMLITVDVQCSAG